MKADLTSRQRDVLDNLPATTATLAARLGVKTTTVRDYLAQLRDRGYEFSRDSSGRYHSNSEQAGSAPPERPTGASKAQITREANKHLAELNERMNRLLSESVAPVADGGLAYTPGRYDIVWHMTDDHIGAEAHNEHGELLFNDAIAEERIRARTEYGLAQIDAYRATGREFDTAHVLLGGDLVTGEGIYNHQAWETCLTLDEQIDLAVRLYFEVIERLAATFPTVQVVCTEGNHGELRADGMSQEANADRIVYQFLDQLVRVSGLTNVSVIRNQYTGFTNFEMRDGLWSGHLRHGKDCPTHIGTSSSLNKWRGWQMLHGYDVAYRGHFHEFKIEQVLGRPVIMSGSISPPGDYEESLAVWSGPASFIHAVSDDAVMEWFKPIYFNDPPSQLGRKVAPIAVAE